MRWFRTNMRFGACSALLALALQITLLFGHVHLNPIAPLGINAKAVASVDVPGGARAPAAPKSQHRSAGDFCAICSLIQLAGQVLPSASKPLPLPIALPCIVVQPCAQLALAQSQCGCFQARAPPLS